MTGVLALTAADLEARGLARELRLARLSRFSFPVYEGAPGSGRDVVLRVAPGGLGAALLPERWAALVADLTPSLVVSAGTCGALAPGLGVGDLILPDGVLGSAGERFRVAPAAHAAALQRVPAARRGLFLASTEAVATPEAKAACWRATGAVAVDMESAAILAWASRVGCPSLVVRAVVDSPSQHLRPELVGLMTREGRVRGGRAVALALTRPRTISEAVVLRRGTRLALRSVARALAALLG